MSPYLEFTLKTDVFNTHRIRKYAYLFAYSFAYSDSSVFEAYQCERKVETFALFSFTYGAVLTAPKLSYQTNPSPESR